MQEMKTKDPNVNQTLCVLEMFKKLKMKGGVREMRKTIIISLMALLSIMLVYGFADAGGPCADCHTMHYSQNGAKPANAASGGPFGTLLVANGCIGCHGQGTVQNIVNDQIPQVLHIDPNDLAGGNFAYITGAKAVDAADSVAVANPDTVGHNVVDINNAEGIAAMFPPPGDEFGQTGITSTTFTCAGAYGCHGNRAIAGETAAMEGAHHVSDTVLKFGTLDESAQGGSVGLSYRFLKGVKGAEHAAWNDGATPSSHNEYKGATDGVEGSATTPGGGTINGLCAECHGNFHGPRAVDSDITDTGTGSPWLRHPTDIVLPNSGEYQYYNGGAGSGAAADYSLDAPVARANTLSDANYPTAKGTVTPGSNDAIVMCLSCHMAHASANADILRWNYEDIQVGTGGNVKCYICHTTKND